jgi:hypothetical protein
MLIDRNRDDLLQCVLVLGMILSDITKDALKLQTFQRLKREGLAEKEVEPLKEALMDLDASLDRIRGALRLVPAAHQTRDRLNESVNGILEKMLEAGAQS